MSIGRERTEDGVRVADHRGEPVTKQETISVRDGLLDLIRVVKQRRENAHANAVSAQHALARANNEVASISQQLDDLETLARKVGIPL